jgi:membrane-associated protease RseP (regulator of RpoE activity)
MTVRRWAEAVGVLAGTVMLHELAHAFAARRAGGTVREVGIGFGPALARRRVGGVQVSLRPVPLGGFAAIEIENLPPHRRVPVLLAGPLANIAVGLLLRAMAGTVRPASLPGHTRRVEVGGLVTALAVLTRASASGPRVLARAAADVNLSVGLANLVPLLPLDGGHLAVARLEAAGAGRPLLAAFRQVTSALFLWIVARVLLADLARLRGAAAR